MTSNKKVTNTEKKRSWQTIQQKIVGCEKCPRLRKHCQKVAEEKRRAFAGWEYWGKPVPDFGDPQAQILVVGLAPAAHGANRTGRMFTGDRSGEWLYRAMHRANLANQAKSEHADDGLIIKGAAVTAVVHCAPPQNKPQREEIDNCRGYFQEMLNHYPWQVIIALGQIAWSAVFRELKRRGEWSNSVPKFGHAKEQVLPDGRRIISSYHPSQQNTFTGRLTEDMFDEVFSMATES